MSSPDGGSAGGYSRADRLLHRLAMNPAVLDLSFDLERARYAAAARARARDGGAPIFVTGLARAGTTILLRLLHDSGQFASLTYRDMPFPLAPNSWQKMSGRSRHDLAARERGHGDGIVHDLDSPEAIEEVFWRTTEGKRYITRSHLHPHDPTSDTVESFRDLVALVCHRYDRPRYLSKNNANALRLGGIVAAFPDAVLIHPFRDPLQQAASLLNQHRRAVELGRADPFRASYMRWLGHYEFGRSHRPPLIPGAPAASEPTDRIDYWLAIWSAVHRLLLDQPEAVGARQVFVDYDALCAQPAAGVARIVAAAGVALGRGDGLRPPPVHAVEGASNDLLAEARAVHAQLIARAR
jgi:hypothetical protein